jgi:hypothetical protein
MTSGEGKERGREKKGEKEEEGRRDIKRKGKHQPVFHYHVQTSICYLLQKNSYSI